MEYELASSLQLDISSKKPGAIFITYDNPTHSEQQIWTQIRQLEIWAMTINSVFHITWFPYYSFICTDQLHPSNIRPYLLYYPITSPGEAKIYADYPNSFS